jgi:hypothetical protein
MMIDKVRIAMSGNGPGEVAPRPPEIPASVKRRPMVIIVRKGTGTTILAVTGACPALS